MACYVVYLSSLNTFFVRLDARQARRCEKSLKGFISSLAACRRHTGLCRVIMWIIQAVGTALSCVLE